jgi:isoamylase
MQGAYIKWAV